MGAPKRLVILGANLTALAVLRSAKRLGIEPYVADVVPGPAFDSRLATRLIGQDGDRSSLISAIIGLGAGHDAWLVSSADAWTNEIIHYRQPLDAAFTKVLHPCNDTLAVCLSKSRFAEWCVANAIPTPRQYNIDPVTCRPLDDVMLPALVRPASTQHTGAPAGIAKARELNSLEDLYSYLDLFRAARVAPIVSQSLLGRDVEQISVGVAMADEKVLCVVAKKLRPSPRACRVGTLVETVEDPAAEELATQAMRKLRYQGIGEVEILKDLDTGEMYVIEINARPWAQFGIGAAAGRDLLRFIVAGGEVGAPSRQSSRRWLEFSGDLWTCFNKQDGMVRQGQLSFAEYLQSLIHADVYARWMLTDPMPALREGSSLALGAIAALFRMIVGRRSLALPRPR